jgi:hypothetical protein
MRKSYLNLFVALVTGCAVPALCYGQEIKTQKTAHNEEECTDSICVIPKTNESYGVNKLSLLSSRK